MQLVTGAASTVAVVVSVMYAVSVISPYDVVVKVGRKVVVTVLVMA